MQKVWQGTTYTLKSSKKPGQPWERVATDMQSSIFDPYHWKIAMQLIACLLCCGPKSYLVSVTTLYQNLKTQ